MSRDVPESVAPEDPRVTGEFVRRVPSGDAESGVERRTGDATLVGVVHNHPASKYRVRAVLSAADPDALALELPPLAVPLYEEYADDGRTPPAFGGEMSTAIQAASTDRVAGIDGPDPAFAARLCRMLVAEDASLSTARSVLGSLVPVTKRAVLCRLAGTVAAKSGVRLEVDDPVGHECAWADDPEEQARDERAQVRQAQTIAETFEPPDSTRVRDSTRDQHMAERLETLRESGDVLAVVGIAHLEPLAERLESG